MLSGGSQILVSSLSSGLDDDVGGFGSTVVLSDVTPEHNRTWYQI